jgi:phosphoglycolate phosphatase
VRRAADGFGGPAPRIVYTDLDGTVFGPGGSLFASVDGGVTARAANALAALHAAGTVLMPISGRTVTQVRETARLLGTRDFVAELGGVTCYDLDREVHRRPSGFDRGGTPFDAMASSGAAGMLLDAYSGLLEPHAPWAFEGHEVSMLLRGLLDLDAARGMLRDSGYDWLNLEDNGVLSRPFPSLRTDEVHVYHLLPRGVGKAEAVRDDLDRRGLRPHDAVAVGDSATDAAVAPFVRAVFIVANGRRALEAATPPGNVYLTEGWYGDGFAEAIVGVLGGPGPPG